MMFADGDIICSDSKGGQYKTEHMCVGVSEVISSAIRVMMEE